MYQLKKVDLCRCPRMEEKARRLYERAFPKEERLPWWLMKLNARREGIDLTGWLDGQEFCGFTASVTVDGLHFLLFFAVSEEKQGQGYGSCILQILQKRYGEVVLNVELLDETAPNFVQRKRRFAFYEKNGFYDTGYHVWEIGGKFRVLCTKADFNVNRYKKLFKKLSLGFWNVKLLKEKK